MSEGHGFGQMCPKGGVIRPGEVYHPARDVVNIFPAMLRSLVLRYNGRKFWPDLVAQTAKLMGCDEEQANDAICDANDVFFKFLGECCRNSEENYGAVLRRLGWEDLPQPARQAFHSMLGAVTAGMMFVSLRDVSQDGEVPSQFVKSLLTYRQMAYTLDEARRLENRLPSREETLQTFHDAVQSCLHAGFDYDDLKEVLRDIKIGRVPAE